ncbi:unnamed protein product [Pleuronectes platessa]|uniref:Uncharacterized protein n=1 Tax=Pleuronectes platessa TaxID=8262 RepID=A0A9N7U416_PLEPL|nr:unnamed protein product [Pleuronectes platessa]
MAQDWPESPKSAQGPLGYERAPESPLSQSAHSPAKALPMVNSTCGNEANGWDRQHGTLALKSSVLSKGLPWGLITIRGVRISSNRKSPGDILIRCPDRPNPLSST